MPETGSARGYQRCPGNQSVNGTGRWATTRYSGDSVVGGVVAVGAGLDAADAVDDEAVAVEQQAQLARRVATGPQVDLGDRAVGVADLGALVGDAEVGVERGVGVVADGEVGVEGAEGQTPARVAAPGRCRRGRRRPRRAAVISPNAPWQRQMTASNSASKGRARASRRSNVAPGGASARGEVDERPGDVDAVDDDRPAGRARGRGAPARTRRRAPDRPVADRARRRRGRPPAPSRR